MKNIKCDSVKMMRNIHNEITEEFKQLSSKEVIDYLNKKYPDFNKKKSTPEVKS